jgi:hypothetical protein
MRILMIGVLRKEHAVRLHHHDLSCCP